MPRQKRAVWKPDDDEQTAHIDTLLDIFFQPFLYITELVLIAQLLFDEKYSALNSSVSGHHGGAKGGHDQQVAPQYTHRELLSTIAIWDPEQLTSYRSLNFSPIPVSSHLNNSHRSSHNSPPRLVSTLRFRTRILVQLPHHQLLHHLQ